MHNWHFLGLGSFCAPVRRISSGPAKVVFSHVASIVASLRLAASPCTVGATPCAENITMALLGIFSVRSAKTAPFLSKDSTTYSLWTISCQT